MVGELEGRDEISRRDFLTDRLSTGWGRAVTEFFRALILNLHISMLMNTREFFNFDIKPFRYLQQRDVRRKTHWLRKSQNSMSME